MRTSSHGGFSKYSCPGKIWNDIKLVIYGAMIFGLGACSTMKAYHVAQPLSREESRIRCEPDASSGLVSIECADRSSELTEDYDLHYTEFDDQGWKFPDGIGQISSAVEHLQKTLVEKPVRLFVFVHGWRHFAKSDDSDVAHFRLFLKSISKKMRNQERVVGIYVGWRGLPISEAVPLTYLLTFWDRKSAAEHVAQGSVRELFGRLSALHNHSKSVAPQNDGLKRVPSTSQSSRLHTYVIGHSFGAAIAFRSLSQSLIEDFTADLDTETNTVARSVDMVMLLNPAIEAARFEPLWTAAHEREAHCPDAPDCAHTQYQAPVLVILSSEGDAATGTGFPIGAKLGNLTENESTSTPAEESAVRHTIGWDNIYNTHRLQAEQNCKSTGPSVGAGTSKFYAPKNWKWCIGDMSITQNPGISPARVYNGPLWNIRVTKEVMLNHGDIWNSRIQSVLLTLFDNSLDGP